MPFNCAPFPRDGGHGLAYFGDVWSLKTLAAMYWTQSLCLWDYVGFCLMFLSVLSFFLLFHIILPPPVGKLVVIQWEVVRAFNLLGLCDVSPRAPRLQNRVSLGCLQTIRAIGLSIPAAGIPVEGQISCGLNRLCYLLSSNSSGLVGLNSYPCRVAHLEAGSCVPRVLCRQRSVRAIRWLGSIVKISGLMDAVLSEG